MKAIVCTRYGQTNEVVELRDMPVPEMRVNDVLIKVHSASLNPIDFKIQQGAMKAIMKFKFPLILGFDVSGEVVQVGAGVQNFKVGDWVFSRVASDRFGTLAEYVSVDENLLALKPNALSHDHAAALPLVSLTAWQALHTIAQVKPGQKVLIHAGAGGIGTIAIQIAKHLGAHVATTTSTPNVSLVKSLGADTVVDYKTTSFEKVLQGYDMVFETLGGDNLAKSFSVLKPGGIVVSIVGIPTADWGKKQGLPVYIQWLLSLLNIKPNQMAKRLGVRYMPFLMEPDGQQLAHIGGLAAQGILKPIIDRSYPLAQTKEALLYLQQGRATGKVIIEIGL
ncbi:MAG TPA: NADP-dependent oxidoreductase [Burkholderiaceae bacterium]|nr:NADP-dependent oxidoreductase [Burkholderiaceae bacterium]